VWVVGEKGRGTEYHAWRAVPALHHAQLSECSLDWVQPASSRQAFDGGHGAPFDIADVELAGRRRLPVYQDGARATGALAAAILGAGQAQFLAQHVQQTPLG